ncbi:MAG: C40 family peptidase [Candidatus Xenobium sp.]|nr:C40 family peptidase [Burkholderiales bacterium]
MLSGPFPMQQYGMGMPGMTGMQGTGMTGMSGMGMMPGMTGTQGTGMMGMPTMNTTMAMLSQMMMALQLQIMQQMMQLLAAFSKQQGTTTADMSKLMTGFLNGGTNPANAFTSAAGAAPLSTSSVATPQTGPTAKVQNFINIACAQQGKPYVFGAEGPNAFDCSGLVAYSLQKAGINVGRTTARGYQAMFKNSAVSRDQLQPGDLIFYHYKNNRGIPSGQASHIEIYLGNGMAMGTDNPKEGARIEKVDWNAFIGGARVPGLYS